MSSSDSFVPAAAWTVRASDYGQATPATELSDEDLMLRVKSGDQAAIDKHLLASTVLLAYLLASTVLLA